MHNYLGHSFPLIWSMSILLMTIDPTFSQQPFQSRSVFSPKGTQFVPVNEPAQLLSTISTSSLMTCAVACNENILCRIFDYGVSTLQQCRLFEGDTDISGSIVSSSSPQSTVGIVQISANLFVQHGFPCMSNCEQSRYLICNTNSTCQCVPHTYWNQSIGMCVPQLPVLGATCQIGITMCREDLNYSCLGSSQCGFANLLIGTTVAGYGNGSSGSDAQGLNQPRGIYVSPLNEALYVSDAYNFRAQRFDFGTRSGVTVAGGNGNGWASNQTNNIWNTFVDTAQNVYVADRNNNRATRWAPSATQGIDVANAFGIVGVTRDSYGNLYTPLFDVHVVLRNNVTILAGNYNKSGSAPTYLYKPRGIFFDESTSSLFVCDSSNHRIQKFQMNSSVGETVAGGNGAGFASDQLNVPNSVWVSPKTGFIYVADTNNHRIQLWKMNDTKGRTIAGNGTAGNLTTMLNTPQGVALNANETFLYVSEQNNHRVQRFNLLCLNSLSPANQSAACINQTFFF